MTTREPPRLGGRARAYALVRDVVADVGTHVRRTRLERDLTQTALGTLLGLSRQAVSRLERGDVVRSSTLEVALAWLALDARRELVARSSTGDR